MEEQAQLLWALSDRAVPRYRKPPPEQPEQPTPAEAPTKVRTEKEVRFTLSPDEGNNPHSSTATPCQAPPAVVTRNQHKTYT